MTSTSLTVSELRAKLVLDEITAQPELIETVDDVARLPRLDGWTEAILGAAIDELVARGCIVESADGRLLAKRWKAGRVT